MAAASSPTRSPSTPHFTQSLLMSGSPIGRKKSSVSRPPLAMLSSTGQVDGHAMTKKPARRGRAKSSRNRQAAKRMTAENRIGTVAVHTDEKLAPRVREIQNRPPMMAKTNRTRSEEVASLRMGRCLCSWLGINRKAANTAAWCSEHKSLLSRRFGLALRSTRGRSSGEQRVVASGDNGIAIEKRVHFCGAGDGSVDTGGRTGEALEERREVDDLKGHGAKRK
ncbi:protein of unknown function (plasmid) [Paraburkholderia dioscoreae]|uniref:Uncharacterized protein n=1 Tax=Paraburkholderia dioscoreae TaxID=2604047 RepID=A0A5Q4Z9U2_9BURK|nr:protein of unknown function [Paraburkholderia dioscoreae]